MENPKPLPDTNSPISAPFWAATRAHHLEMPRCEVCGYIVWPAARMCPECLSWNLKWIPIAPRGVIWTFAVYHRAFHPSFRQDLPYNVAMIALEAGPLVVGNVLAPAGQLRIGAPVEATFDDVTAEVTLVKWKLVNDPR